MNSKTTVRRLSTVTATVALVLAAVPAMAGAAPSGAGDRGVPAAATRPAPTGDAAKAAAAARGAAARTDAMLVSSGGQTVSAAELLAVRPDPTTMRGSAGAGGSPGRAKAAAGAKAAPTDRGLAAALPTPRVQDTATGTYPSSAIVYIELNGWRCTGFMLSPDTVVTAAHCLYDYHNGGGWKSSYTVWPGRSDSYQPFGSCSGAISGNGWVPTTWVNTGNIDYDFAAINLSCTVGNQSGWLGWWYDPGEQLIGQSFYAEGYPGAKPGITMWYGYGPVTWRTEKQFGYFIEWSAGQSGGPVYKWRPSTAAHCQGWCVAGIATHHAPSPEGSASGTLMHPDAYNMINWVIDQP